MTAVDTFATSGKGSEGPARHAFAITPHATNELTYVTRALYVGAAGDVAAVMAGGEAVTFVGLAAGVAHPLRVKAVRVTGTTATGIVGVY